MIKLCIPVIALLIILTGFNTINNSDIDIESLKLTESDLPDGYKFTEKLNCQAIQPELFYENPDIYAAMIGKVKNKSFQSFKGKKDSGSILYFEFEEEFESTGFLGGLMWGGSSPTKAHPEEIMVKGNFLIIWSTVKKSKIKAISKKKIKAVKISE